MLALAGRVAAGVGMTLLLGCGGATTAGSEAETVRLASAPVVTPGPVTTAPAPSTSTTAGSAAVEATTASQTAWGKHLPPGAVADPLRRAVPIRLRIPALGVDAPVGAHGVAPDGSLALPADATTVAWFEGGAVPGDSGSSVLAAHVDYDGEAGTFFALAGLAAGEVLEVVLSDGTSRRFSTAGEARIFDKASLPVAELFRRGAEPQVTLVTCGGRFDAATRSYENNTVVVATPLR